MSMRKLLVEILERRCMLSLTPGSISPDGIWTVLDGLPERQLNQTAYIQPTAYASLNLDRSVLAARLSNAPLEFTPHAASNPVEIVLPKPDGGMARFTVEQSPIMEPGLAAKFPEITTYRGQGIDDPAATLRFDVSPSGFRAQVLSPEGVFYIDPYWGAEDTTHISYYRRDLAPRAGMEFFEVPIDGSDSESEEASSKANASASSQPLSSVVLQRSGAQLRTYRLANAATAEYTAFHGGTVALGQAAIVTAVNRVNGIYETELAVRLVLVANNASLVYTNAATDPYTNNDPEALLSENQANIDSVIGSANYDIGHVFSTGGGGLAGLGVVGVNGQKAQGETGLPAPIGDAFFVDYVAHEMGHQFGGEHTFNGVTDACSGGNRNAGTAYEPGSGSTIQGYAGICGSDNLQTSSDPYFHSASFDEIVAYTTSGAGNAAAAITNTGNNVPRINAGANFAIPAQTAFVLEAAGRDIDVSDSLTYNFEQRDLGPAQAVSAPDNGSSPLFRSFTPASNPQRVLPRLSDLLNNTTTVGEKLPTTNRTLNFRATVRDNRSGGGGVNSDDLQITVVNTGAPFAVTSPNTALSWAGNSTQTVTWNVAGTTAAPINATNVNIWLSTNGGTTFPILLSANTPNDGSQTITVPDINVASARIKVEATNSPFFDLSNANFSISGGVNTPPTISGITNRLADAGMSTGTIPFTIGDAQTAATSLVVARTTSNPTLIPLSNIVLGGTGANRTVTVTPATGQFGQATVFVSVTDGAGLTVQETFIVFVEPVITCVPYQSFDSVTAPALPSGWTTSASGAAATNWVTSNVSSSDGTNNAFVSNPANTSDSRLTSPTIAVTLANNQIKFRNNYNLESTYDGGVLEISINGGAFSDIITAGGSFKQGGYNSAILSGSDGALAGRPAWTGNSSGYIDTIAELPASAIGNNVQWRWRMASDSSAVAVGWRIDAIQTCGIVVVNPPPTILNVIAAGSTWGAAFIDAVDGGGVGSGNGLGYSLTSGTTLPNTGINRLYVQFSEPVIGFNASTLALLGVNVPNYASVATVTYDSVNMQGVIQLSTSIARDKLRLGVSDTVTDTALTSLDGDANTIAGGDFDFRFNILVGDASNDGSVNGGDLTSFATAFNTSTGNALYNARVDWNADGSVNGGDLTLFASNFNQSLPSAEPGPLNFLPLSVPFDLKRRSTNAPRIDEVDEVFSQLDNEDELVYFA